MSHRPNDYHPDHRYTGILVQDSAYMVAVPFFCPDVPPLKANPVFLFYPDQFQKPNPFLRNLAGRFCHGLKYEMFRDLILARMHDAQRRPSGMEVVIKTVLED